MRQRDPNGADQSTVLKIVWQLGIRFVQTVAVDQLPDARRALPALFFRLALLIQLPVLLALARGFSLGMTPRVRLSRRVFGRQGFVLFQLVAVLAGFRVQFFSLVRRHEPSFQQFIP